MPSRRGPSELRMPEPSDGARRKLGPVSGPERTTYLARLAAAGDDASWGRPASAIEVCQLLDVSPGELLMPRYKGARAKLTAAQAFTVALDAVLMAGEKNLRLT